VEGRSPPGHGDASDRPEALSALRGVRYNPAALTRRPSLALFLLTLLPACGASTPAAPSSAEERIIGLSGNLAFGTVPVGSPAVRTLAIANSGNAPLTVTNVKESAGFIASWRSGTIAAGQTQVITITFFPTAAGAYNTVVVVEGNQTSGTNSAAMTGTAEIAKANLKSADTAVIRCMTGVCSDLIYDITNTGTGCATNVAVTTRFYGGDGAGPQLGVDVPMYSTTGYLSDLMFTPGFRAVLQNLIFFNDVRSAHTKFKAEITWTDTPCPRQ
jgi:hypothetical protein